MTFAALVPAVGWGWGEAKVTFVQRTEFEKSMVIIERQRFIDSVTHAAENKKLDEIKTAIDSVSIRIRQIKCSPSDPSCR